MLTAQADASAEALGSVRAASRSRTPISLHIALCIVLSLPVLALSCAQGADTPYIVGTSEQKAELKTLFALLSRAPDDPEERFALNKRIADILMARKEYGKVQTFLAAAAAADSEASYQSYYLFQTAWSHALQGSASIAAWYYHRIIKNWPDLILKGESIHLACLIQLISLEPDHEQRVDYYREILARFPDRIDLGATLFELGQTYEKLGEWDLAVQTYQRMIPFPETEIPGFPDAYQYARKLVDFWSSSRNWTFESLSELVKQVQEAIRAQDPWALEKLKAKVNFFAMTWSQSEMDENSQVEFDMPSVMKGWRITVEQELDPASNSRNAYLKTRGWERIPVWYFYFRKIYFPADPEIHGRWEWAGIYFGEKLK